MKWPKEERLKYKQQDCKPFSPIVDLLSLDDLFIMHQIIMNTSWGNGRCGPVSRQKCLTLSILFFFIFYLWP